MEGIFASKKAYEMCGKYDCSLVGKLCILKREKSVTKSLGGTKIYEADKARAQAGTR